MVPIVIICLIVGVCWYYSNPKGKPLLGFFQLSFTIAGFLIGSTGLALSLGGTYGRGENTPFWMMVFGGFLFACGYYLWCKDRKLESEEDGTIVVPPLKTDEDVRK